MPAVALCLFAGYALLGFTELPEAACAARWTYGERRRGGGGAIGLLSSRRRSTNVTEELRVHPRHPRSLIAPLDDPAVRAGLRCGPLTFPTYRLVPDAAGTSTDASDRRAVGLAAPRAASRSSRSARRRCGATGSRRARARGSNVAPTGTGSSPLTRPALAGASLRAYPRLPSRPSIPSASSRSHSGRFCSARLREGPLAQLEVGPSRRARPARAARRSIPPASSAIVTARSQVRTPFRSAR